MSITSTHGSIVTFYSWKGGVGRTMALANVAVQLARQGHGVLMVDWDLEAPGLELYFTNEESFAVSTAASNPTGLMGLLYEATEGEPLHSDWESRLENIMVPPSETSFSNPIPPTPGRLHLLPSGIGSDGYSERLAEFSWDSFFAERQGGIWLEKLRSQWQMRYDFVLIDARTGLSDSSGVCTVQMPDMLVLVFTANDQSLNDGLKIVDAAQQGRNQYAFDRPPLAVVPLLSRWCGDEEVDLGERWMRRFNNVLTPLVSSWMPREFTPYQLLEKIRVPHVARFSFGEPLPVLTHSLTDSNLPGLAFDTLARLLGSNLIEVGRIMDPAYEPLRFKAGYTDDDDLKMLALVQDPIALHREIAHFEKINNSDGSELAAFLNNAGFALVRLKRYAEAEPLYRRSLALSEQINGPDDPKVSICLVNLAQLLQDTNRLAEAEQLIRKALTINEKSFGLDHPDVAMCLNNLSTLLQVTNRLAEAEPLMRRALTIYEKSFGPDHPNVATSLSNLATLLQDTNRLAEAEPLIRRALSISEKCFGPDHPDVAIRLINLAYLLQSTNRLAEAEPLIRRALAIDEKSFGPDHPDVAIDLNNLANLLQETNQLAEAEPLMHRALAIDEKSFGPDHPNVAIRLNNLASLFQETNRLAEAEPLIRRALVIDEKSFGPDHPKVAICLNNLAALFQETNRLAEAEPLIRRALAIDEKYFGSDHPDVAIDLNNLANLLQITNKVADVEPLMRRALNILEIFEQKNGHKHPFHSSAASNYLTLMTRGKSMTDK